MLRHPHRSSIQKSLNLLITLFLLSLACTPASEPVISNELRLEVLELIERHDITASVTRNLVRGLRVKRAWDSNWTKRNANAFAFGQLWQSSNMLERLDEIGRRSELDSEVQEALAREGNTLRGWLKRMEGERSAFNALDLPEDLLGAFISPLDVEIRVLSQVYEYYEDEQFLRKGRSFDGDELELSAVELISLLTVAPDELQEAMILWEAAKIRFDVFDELE